MQGKHAYISKITIQSPTCKALLYMFVLTGSNMEHIIFRCLTTFSNLIMSYLPTSLSWTQTYLRGHYNSLLHILLSP